MIKESIIGKKFTYLIVLKSVGYGNYLCFCTACGKEKIAYITHLKNGNSKSCGCVHNRKHGHNTSKGKSRTYCIWDGMIQRCRNFNHTYYKNYGGRGIKICDRWLGNHGFENFLSDVGEFPGDGYSIERIDNDGNYTPENCRWATMKEQSRNRRRNVWIEFGERKMVLKDWAILLHVSYPAIKFHLRKGEKIREILEIFQNSNFVSSETRRIASQILKEEMI